MNAVLVCGVVVVGIGKETNGEARSKARLAWPLHFYVCALYFSFLVINSHRSLYGRVRLCQKHVVQVL